MKIIIDENIIILYINKQLIKINIEEKKELEVYIKKLIVLLKSKKIDLVSGLYIARIYFNDKYGMIVELENIEELEYFKDMYDLKIVIYNDSDIYLEMNDYHAITNNKKILFNDNYYININDLNDKELLRYSEFSRLVYGEELDDVLENGKLIV